MFHFPFYVLVGEHPFYPLLLLSLSNGGWTDFSLEESCFLFFLYICHTIGGEVCVIMNDL